MKSAESVVPVHQAVLAWYKTHGRDLPWRRTSDPYHILVAEVMLQQTQVDRVLPKYKEFLEVFPTVAALAAASRGHVIRLWAPLGYNLRAVRLQDVAQQVIDRWGGRFPDREQDLLALRGIGPYTARAIRCFAFRKPAVFLDTNLRRVIGRCFAGLPFPRPDRDREILAIAQEVLPAARPYEWHQAIMDLGATVCRWSRPQCVECPLALSCRARAILNTQRLAVAEPTAGYHVQSKFTGSRRYYRGRMVSLLRELAPGECLNPALLGAHLKPDWSAGDLQWLMELLAGLERDGLVKVMPGGVSLP